MFKTIRENATAEIVEKKSKFIANIFYVESDDEAEKIIKEISKKYYDARHNCYAYSVYTENGIMNRFSDNGEPSGTAGAPMLNILTSQNISNVLVIVTRYFGGILLGTGGLVKAYSEATQESLKKVQIISKDLGIEVNFQVNYSDIEKIKYYFRKNEIKIIDIKYAENAEIICELTNEKYDEILKNVENLNFKILNSMIIKSKYIEVKDE